MGIPKTILGAGAGAGATWLHMDVSVQVLFPKLSLNRRLFSSFVDPSGDNGHSGLLSKQSSRGAISVEHRTRMFLIHFCQRFRDVGLPNSAEVVSS